jgi:hypothetical protein
MPYGTGSYGSLPYGGDFDSGGGAPVGVAGSAGWWWDGPAARMLADAGFLLLVKPPLEERDRQKKGGDASP